MTWQGVSEAECYDNRSVIAQIVRIKDRLTAVEQNVDPTLRTDLEAAIAELTALENTVANVQTAVGTNTGNIEDLQDDLDALSTSTTAALALKADAADVDADLELKADMTQLTDGSVTKVGTTDIGTDNSSRTGTPVILVSGVPTAMANSVLDTKHDATLACLFKPGYGFGVMSTETSMNVPTTNHDAIVWVEMTAWQSSTNTGRLQAVASFNDIDETVEAMVELDIVLGNDHVSFAKVSTGSSDSSIEVLEVKVMWAASASNNYRAYIRLKRPDKRINMTRQLTSGYLASKFYGQTPATTVYEDIAYDGQNYPNVTNYIQYPWTTIGTTYTKLAKQ